MDLQVLRFSLLDPAERAHDLRPEFRHYIGRYHRSPNYMKLSDNGVLPIPMDSYYSLSLLTMTIWWPGLQTNPYIYPNGCEKIGAQCRQLRPEVWNTVHSGFNKWDGVGTFKLMSTLRY